MDSNPHVLLAGETLPLFMGRCRREERRMPSVSSPGAGKWQSKRRVLESKGEQTHFWHAEYADSLFSECVICLVNNEV